MIIFSENRYNNFSNSLTYKQNTAIKQNIITYITNKNDNKNNMPNNRLTTSNISRKYEQNDYINLIYNKMNNNLMKKDKDIYNRNNQIINIKKSNKNNHKLSFDSSKKNINIEIRKNKDEQNLKELLKLVSNDKNKKYNNDSLSEIKNFKTELCHSWELTGTCKYGQNVKI